MKKLLVACTVILPLTSYSSEKVFYPAPGCKLFSFSSGKFTNASPSNIPAGTPVDVKPHPKRSDFQLFKYDQVSYGAISSCFGAASAESAEIPLDVSSDSPPLAEEVHASSSGNAAKDYRATVFFRTTLNGYSFTDGEAKGSSSTDSQGTVTSYSKIDIKAGLGFLLGFQITDSGSIIAGYRQLKATQSGSLVNTAAGVNGSVSSELKAKFYTLGYQHALKSSLPIIPYIQGNLVYGKTEDSGVLTGFTGTLASYNGNAKLIENSIGAHIEMGAILPIAKNFGVSGGLGLTFYSGKKSKVDSSTSANFTVGDEVKSDYGMSHLNFALGAQIQF